MNNLWHKHLPYDASSDLIVFTVDTTSPFVSVLSPVNASYESIENLLDVTLNFTVNEPVSRLSYSLDGQENVTIAGNTTLVNLPYGEHNVTVYAWDTIGRKGTSETIVFTVSGALQSSLSVLVVGASGAFLAVGGLSVLFFFKKGKKP